MNLRIEPQQMVADQDVEVHIGHGDDSLGYAHQDSVIFRDPLSRYWYLRWSQRFTCKDHIELGTRSLHKAIAVARHMIDQELARERQDAQ